MWRLKAVAFACVAAYFVNLVSTTSIRPPCKPCNPCDPDSFCNPNEEFNNCSNALCRHQLCSQKDDPIGCPSVVYCLRACVCKKGYLRDDNTGKCIPEKKCEKKVPPKEEPPQEEPPEEEPPTKPKPVPTKPKPQPWRPSYASATATATGGYAAGAATAYS